MSTSIISSTNGNGATTTSSAFTYAIDDVVRATVVNPAGGLVTPCLVTLQLSADGGITYRAIDTRRAGMEDSGTSSLVFEFLAYSRQAAWTHARLVFSGNTASSQLGVAVSAVGDGGTWTGAGASTGLTITQHSAVVATDTPSAGAVTCDLSVADAHQVTMAVSTLITLANPAVSKRQAAIFYLIQGGSGSCVPTFSPAVIWGTAGTPAWSTAVGKTDIITLDWNGTTYRGAVVGLGY